MDWLLKYNPRIDWVDSLLCFDDAVTDCCLHAYMQGAEGSDGCGIVDGFMVP